MPRAVAAILCVAVHALVLVSPLVHAHPEGHGGDHEHVSVHAHLGGHTHQDERDGPAVEQEHERAVYLPFVISQPVSAFDLSAGDPQAFEIVVPNEDAGFVAVAVSHGHDPPLVDAIPPRAPPVFPTFI